MDEYNLSKRAAQNVPDRDVWGPREKSMGNPWSPENPGGTVILRLAENSLLHEDVAAFMKTQMNILPTNHLTYSTGPRGSLRLRNAIAGFFNEQFKSREIITADHLCITSGLAGAIDALTWAVCDEGEGIMIPQPFYNGFSVDVLNRSLGRVVPVPYHGIDGYTSLEDVFDPENNEKALERALSKAQHAGIKVRALLISHPHNPLGRCYPPETLKQFAAFCGRNNLHFISDEIYALSVFPNPELPHEEEITSTLALDFSDVLDEKFHHVMYGASKDFCANGLRLGVVCSRNRGVIQAMSSIGIFSWSPHVIQDVWASILEDKTWLDAFMHKKRSLMRNNYEIMTSFLQNHNIPYFPMNAAVFIWINLQHLFSVDPQHHQRSEQRITETCLKHGVMIAPGSVYVPENFGWFRVTFTVAEDALRVGLERLGSALEELELVIERTWMELL